MKTERTHSAKRPGILKAGPDGASQDRNGPVAVLSVSPSMEDHDYLRRICQETSWKTYEAYTCREAMLAIAGEQLDVVLCEASLPDGNWKDILAELLRRSNSPDLIVTSGLADDRLWAEVLSLGGYDVLMKPFDVTEVHRVVGLACDHHQAQQV